MKIDRWLVNQMSPGEVARVLTVISSPPNVRSRPLPGDRQDRHFGAWFDGGGIIMPTGGASEYVFDDGLRVSWAGLSPRLELRIVWPDGRSVRVEQVSDLPQFEP